MIGPLSYSPYSKLINDKALLQAAVYRTGFVKGGNLTQKELESLDEKLSQNKLALNSSSQNELDNKEKGFLTIYLDEEKSVKLSAFSVYLLDSNFQGLYERKDGSFIAHGSSLNFLKAWHNEIAFNRGYLAADANKDSFIDEQESLNLKTAFKPSKTLLCYDQLFMQTYGGVNSYDKLSKYTHLIDEKTRKIFIQESLNLALDTSIKLDKNLDGIITYEDIIHQNLDTKNNFHLFVKNYFNEKMSEFKPEEFLKWYEEQKAKINALMQEKINDELKNLEEDETAELKSKLLTQGFESLSADEKLAVRRLFPDLVKSLDLEV
ncbi:hypothetical protein DMB92_00065 [Campylobacter sp. MIT 99-7217]|uniref:hypothetical protein n=1 Tax=Campylobacter sp. MIT 99-7217 TaxID=535091 RepID=UPI0011582526|nr:hypothetical protein [Campylobacter sp. MIT 99-7217]TQR34400.1 hypothetical protein DMB92_00065 [Campylobacter sp. MIT 99-7217]